MKVAMDAAGRIIIPKALRVALGFKPGQPLEARVTDGRLELAIAPTPMRLRRHGNVLLAIPQKKLPPLTAEQVRKTLERVRR